MGEAFIKRGLGAFRWLCPPFHDSTLCTLHDALFFSKEQNIMSSDRMMEYYYSMGQDCLHIGNLDDAMTYFRKAANMGAHEAAYEICVIGRRMETGDGVEKDEEKAESCYKIGVEYDITSASLYLGKLYLRGIHGGKPNPRKARRALEHASDMGNAEAAALLGKAYDEGRFGKVNPEKALHYYLLAAERGDTSAMLMVGLFYAQGSSTAKDLTAAEMWIRKGCEMGDPDGNATLKVFLSIACREYVTGQAGRVDDNKAFQLAQEAEQLGDKEVYFKLGEAFRHKSQRKGHLKHAFICYEKAAQNEIPAAYSALGLCYEAGLGVEEDIKKAVDLYKKAADQGDPFGMAHYGYALANGEGCAKDEKAAMSWLIKAAMQGDQGAIQTLKEDYQYELQ